MSPNPFSGLVGTGGEMGVSAFDCNDNQYDFTNRAYNWNSNNTGVATLVAAYTDFVGGGGAQGQASVNLENQQRRCPVQTFIPVSNFNSCKVSVSPGEFTGNCDGSPHGHPFSFTLTPAGNCIVSQAQGKTNCTQMRIGGGVIVDSVTCSASTTGNEIDGSVTYSTTSGGQIKITVNATVDGTPVTMANTFTVGCP